MRSVLATLVCTTVLALAAQAQAAPAMTEKTSAGPLVIKPLKHASVLLQFKGKNYYIDPAQLPNAAQLPKADAILITHEHFDHCDPALVEKLRRPETVVIANPGCAGKVGKAEVMKNGDRRKVLDAEVEAVPAYNMVRKQYHPKGRDNGYILTFGGKRIYFAGDTEATPEMKALKNIDIAFLPINLPFTMPPKEAAEAARAFKPRVLIPYHQGQANPQEVADALKDTRIQVRVLKLP
jgi:L-ascorbate metabolism protein UlaG (beta-lactamase superfamily)